MKLDQQRDLCHAQVHMKNLRQIHLLMGCFFAPMIIYFSLSGAWQIFRLNDLPDDKEPTSIQFFLNELSKPHKDSTRPGAEHKTSHSAAFDWIALFMAVGLILTTLIGLVLAFRFSKSPITILACVGVGVALPIILIFIKAK